MRTAPPTVRMSQKAGPAFMKFPRTSGRSASVDAMLEPQQLRRVKRVQVLPTPRVRGRLQKCRQRRPHRRAPIRTMQPLPPRMCSNCSPRRNTPPNPEPSALEPSDPAAELQLEPANDNEVANPLPATGTEYQNANLALNSAAQQTRGFQNP